MKRLEDTKVVQNGWGLYIAIAIILLMWFGFSGCQDTPSDLDGYNCVLVVSGKTDECIVIKKYHLEKYVNGCGNSVDYFTFPKGWNGYNAFKNYSQGDTIK